MGHSNPRCTGNPSSVHTFTFHPNEVKQVFFLCVFFSTHAKHPLSAVCSVYTNTTHAICSKAYYLGWKVCVCCQRQHPFNIIKEDVVSGAKMICFAELRPGATCLIRGQRKTRDHAGDLNFTRILNGPGQEKLSWLIVKRQASVDRRPKYTRSSNFIRKSIPTASLRCPHHDTLLFWRVKRLNETLFLLLSTWQVKCRTNISCHQKMTPRQVYTRPCWRSLVLTVVEMSHDGDAWWLFDWEVRGAPREHSWQGEAALAVSHCLYPASGGTCTAWWGPPSARSRFTPRAAGKRIFRALNSLPGTVLQYASCPDADQLEGSMLTGCHTVGRTVQFF